MIWIGPAVPGELAGVCRLDLILPSAKLPETQLMLLIYQVTLGLFLINGYIHLGIQKLKS